LEALSGSVPGVGFRFSIESTRHMITVPKFEQVFGFVALPRHAFGCLTVSIRSA